MLHVQGEARLAPEHRIYVNRNLKMASIQAVGFDLDHTLAHYRGAAVEELAYRLACRHLVKHFGYPSKLLEKPYNRNFVIRGLVIDKRRGNVLKMDYHNYVSRSCHGFRMLEPDERKATYRSGRVRMASGAYVSVDTLFHLPEVYLYQVLVDLAANGTKRKPRSFATIFENVRESVDAVHADGSLKREILSNLDKYIRRDPRLGPTLSELSRDGKKLFLLTNSEYYYTDALLDFLLRNGKRAWHEYFDLIVVDAGKPDFFTSRDRRARSGDRPEVSCPIYHGGNAHFLEKQLGFRGDQVLYFGDHTYGDILRSKKSSGWRTAMVVEELREEIEITRKVKPQMDELNHWKALRGVMESELTTLEVEHRRLTRRIQSGNGRGTSLAKLRRRLDNVDHELTRQVTELESIKRMTGELGDRINESYNSRWGPIFREGPETSRFGHQVKDFACIYMTRVSNLLNYDMNHYYRSAAELMPHELI